MSDPKLDEIAAVAAERCWKAFGEEQYLASFRGIILAALNEAVEAAVRQEREALRDFITKTVWCGPRCGHGDHQGMREVLAWLDARSRPEEPKP